MTRKHAAAVLAGALLATAALAQKGVPSLLPGGSSKEPVGITAGKLDYYDKEQKLVYSGGVVVTQVPTQMKATTLTIFLAKADGETKAGAAPLASGSSVRRMEATGPVTITSKDQVGTGDNLVYDKPENKVYLTGHAVLSQGANITRGDKLIYDLNTSQAVVVGHVESVFTPGSGADPGAADGGKPPKKPKPK